MINLYEVIPEKYLIAPIKYENYEKMQIVLPCMATIVGGTGAGKTNYVLNFAMNLNAFDCYRIFAKNYKNDPLYLAFIDELKDASTETNTPLIFVESDIEKLPPLESLMTKDGEEHSTLIIIDDMINETNQEALCDYFIAARKYNVTCFYLSQSYFAIPIMIRKQQFYCFICHVHQRDLSRIIPEMNKTDIDTDDVIKLYRHIMREQPKNAKYRNIKHVFTMDGVTHNPHLAFRDGWNVIPDFDRIIHGPDEPEQEEKGPKRRKIKGGKAITHEMKTPEHTSMDKMLESLEAKPVRVKPIGEDLGNQQHRNTLSLLDQFRLNRKQKRKLDDLFS